MARYAEIARTPPEPTTEGDDSFAGVNMGQDRSTLPAGYLALGINNRVKTGAAAPRGGTLTPKWANIVPYPEILGSGLYNNPNRDEVMLIATPAEVLMIKCGSYPTSIPVPAGTTLRGKINFSQDFDKVYLESDDVDLGTLVWNGVLSAGFVPIAQSNPADTTRQLTPNVPWSVNQSDRRVFPLSRDEFGVSDVGDYTSYDYIDGRYRVNAGTADPIVGAVPFTQSYVLVGKKRSWDVLAGFSGDLSDTRMEVMSTDVGLSGRRTARMVGSDIIFLYRTGVYRIAQIIQNRLEATAVPVAAKKAGGAVVDPIGPLLRRINWAVEDNFVAAVLAPYYYLAVAVDGSRTNNALLIYNTVSDEWEGYDTWDPGFQMQIDNLIVTDYQGTPHLYVINHALKAVHVLGEGYWDHNGAAEFEIEHVLETRGYATLGWNGATSRASQRLELALRTWRPAVTVTQLSEGAGDERVLTPTPITRDRTKYFRWGIPDFNPGNANHDFQTPGREDYSVSLADQPIDLDTGINVEQMQERMERFSLKARSRWTSLRIANSQGRAEIGGVLFESKGVGRETRRAA